MLRRQQLACTAWHALNDPYRLSATTSRSTAGTKPSKLTQVHQLAARQDAAVLDEAKPAKGKGKGKGTGKGPGASESWLSAQFSEQDHLTQQYYAAQVAEEVSSTRVAGTCMLCS